MVWNWQLKDWPNFKWDKNRIQKLESDFLHRAGILFGSLKHLDEVERSLLTIDIITGEAVKTSEIEGEILNRESVQSSIRKNFGLESSTTKVSAAEKGISEMMTNLYQTYSKPISHSMLFKWHKMLMRGRMDLNDLGRYRTHKEAMQILSGSVHNAKINFEAPPSTHMKKEMDAFIKWFKDSRKKGESQLPAIVHSGIAHLYFVSIHPFEDGNGRIGRAVAEKSLSMYLGQPTLIALAQMIEKKRNDYYQALERCNNSLDLTDWLIYYGNTLIDAIQFSMDLIEFIIEKSKFFKKFPDTFNSRQEKVILRLFKAGPEGFLGGLSAENYISITRSSRATATRDLQDLVLRGALIKTGKLKGTRYYLKLATLKK